MHRGASPFLHLLVDPISHKITDGTRPERVGDRTGAEKDVASRGAWRGGEAGALRKATHEDAHRVGRHADCDAFEATNEHALPGPRYDVEDGEGQEADAEGQKAERGRRLDGGRDAEKEKDDSTADVQGHGAGLTCDEVVDGKEGKDGDHADGRGDVQSSHEC